MERLPTPSPHLQVLHMRFPMSALPTGTNEFTLASKTWFGNGAASKPFNITRTVRRTAALQLDCAGRPRLEGPSPLPAGGCLDHVVRAALKASHAAPSHHPSATPSLPPWLPQPCDWQLNTVNKKVAKLEQDKATLVQEKTKLTQDKTKAEQDKAKLVQEKTKLGADLQVGRGCCDLGLDT